MAACEGSGVSLGGSADLPRLVVEVRVRFVPAMTIIGQTVGDLQQVSPCLASVGITVAGLPCPAKDLLAEIVGHIGPPHDGQQEAAHGLAVVADPFGKKLLVSVVLVVTHQNRTPAATYRKVWLSG